MQHLLDNETNPSMQQMYQDQITMQDSILSDLSDEATDAGIDASELADIDNQADTTVADNPPELEDENVWESSGANVLFAAYIGAHLGSLQGVANTANGVQDIGVGLLNTGINGLNPLGMFLGVNPQLTSPDWSEGLVTDEDPELHAWSKWLGGNGVVTLASLLPFLPKGFSLAIELSSTSESFRIQHRVRTHSPRRYKMGPFRPEIYVQNPAEVLLRSNGTMVIQSGVTRIHQATKWAQMSGVWELPVILFK